ncbi:pyrroloquinoline quinone biosynthesis peptide chaperone PqqD [Variovorax sp. J22R24]|uniref:pyrroloquinoline quinone biosynthesis peptide chaperone PqqD n=1 Tax=Variovorax gracilis TaxID=3053502 RepID=UPI0025754D41|nr:pyrroloquinoline quinone biosynthesis peptide chaperone PqqD [Variovorax sp. J22R24]MDM0108344.1 pyrroloquinoline quinone biosynthesis peptide chaperone PqqD [Variovorax sp. J22R24]
MITPDARPRMSTLYRMQFEPTHDSWILLYPEGMVRLNAPAAEILQRCDGRRTVDEIVAELEVAFAHAPLHDDVVGFLSQAVQCGWLQQGNA